MIAGKDVASSPIGQGVLCELSYPAEVSPVVVAVVSRPAWDALCPVCRLFFCLKKKKEITYLGAYLRPKSASRAGRF